MAVAPLVAPAGATLQVVSRAACFTWGLWSVNWPEGFTPPDPPAEDRDLGWIADLVGEEPEPFGRCWVRADADIDAELGTSTVEDTLDAAQYRTSGEVFLETEIPHENLAGQLPYVDFRVNSLVPLRLGGRILEDQLVTKIVESEDESGRRRTQTHVGGQKLQDREELRTRNREIDRVIAQERLERGDELGAKIALANEYTRQQRDELKKYVDRRDSEDLGEAKKHAEDEDKKVKAAAATDASTKAGNALATARNDAMSYAGTAQEHAEQYALMQDELKLKEAKKHAEDEDKKVKSSAADDATIKAGNALRDAKNFAKNEDTERLREAKEHAEEEDKKLKQEFNTRVGKDGTLTKLLNDLTEDYQGKLGENGSVILDQEANTRLLSGIVHGTPVAELEGTALWQQQQTINELNLVFQEKQTSVNDGFNYLFGLNEKINLAQDFLIEQNAILAESRTPVYVDLEYDTRRGKFEQKTDPTMRDVVLPLFHSFRWNVYQRKLFITLSGTDSISLLGQYGPFSGRVPYVGLSRYSSWTWLGPADNLAASRRVSVLELPLTDQHIESGERHGTEFITFTGVFFARETLSYYRKKLQESQDRYWSKVRGLS